MAYRLDHIAIYVDDMTAALAFYEETLGLGTAIRKSVPELGIECAFFDTGDNAIIELVTFSGTGELAHGDVVVALEVDDLDAAIAAYRARGLKTYLQAATESLPLRRGWVTKAAGHGTIIELCPKGEFLDFVRNRGKSA